MYGIGHLSVVPIRAQGSDKSEIVTQLLFGELIEVLSQKQQWHKVRLLYDDYEGWMDAKQYIPLSISEYNELKGQTNHVSADLMQFVNIHQIMYPLVLGCTIPQYDGKQGLLLKEPFAFNGRVYATGQPNTNKLQLIETAYQYINSPYLWGGRSPFGIDCSGFTQMVYKLNGIPLKRDAYQQANHGYTLNFLEEAEPGDLAFFDNEEGNIIHVGIILPNKQIIHASGKVRVDNIDHHGIFNVDTKKYSHKLRLIKRII